MVDLNDIHIVERILDATGITQRELIVIILLLILGAIVYVSMLMYRFKHDCKSVSCGDIKKIRELSTEMQNVIDEISEDVRIGRVENREYMGNLSKNIEKLEDDIEDLKKKSYELSGVIFTTTAYAGVDRKRIQHHET